jgi:tRNA U34 2-thiouridine synthase MnmA/TrmU
MRSTRPRAKSLPASPEPGAVVENPVPLGEIATEVRRIAEKSGLPNAVRKNSTGTCFQRRTSVPRDF